MAFFKFKERFEAIRIVLDVIKQRAKLLRYENAGRKS
jgi:hypothetical protein